MRKKIPPEHIKVGMFVCGFGGSWLNHPFWRTKFIVETDADADKIRAAEIPYIEIDEARGAIVDGFRILPDRVPEPAPIESASTHISPRLSGKHNLAAMRLAAAHEIKSGAALEQRHKEQIAHLVDGAKMTMRGLFDDARMGRAIRTQDTVKLIDDIAIAVSRSPRTILDIVRLKKKDEYTFMHSVAVCALMVNVAEFLGKNAGDIREYGQAGLLHDVGKMGIPEYILSKPGPLTDEEFTTVRAHPEHGYRLLAEAGDVSDIALDVCRHHHEKQDGTGYPFGKDASTISEVAALGAICDVYDAMTSNRVYKEAWMPADALSAMWEWHGHFDSKLLFVFMQSIAIFPEGMLVRLRSNRLGLIKSPRRKDIGPRVVAFYSTRDREPLDPEELYLADGIAVDSIIGSADAEQWNLPDWDRLRARLLGRKPVIPNAAPVSPL